MSEIRRVAQGRVSFQIRAVLSIDWIVRGKREASNPAWLGQRILHEVLVTDSAWDLKGKARTARLFVMVGCRGLGCSSERYMPKLGQECVLIVVAAT